MHKELLAQSPLLALPLMALLLFLTVFVVVCFRTLLRRAGDYAPAANMPLQEDGHE